MSDHHHDDHLERRERMKARQEGPPEFYRNDEDDHDDDYVPPAHIPLSRSPSLLSRAPSAPLPGYESWPSCAVLPSTVAPGFYASALMDAMRRIRSESELPFSPKHVEKLYDDWAYFERAAPFEPMPPLPKGHVCRFIWSLTIERRMVDHDAPLLELLSDALEQLTLSTSWYEHDHDCSCGKGLLKEWTSAEAITMINIFCDYTEIAKLYQVSIIELNGIKH